MMEFFGIRCEVLEVGFKWAPSLPLYSEPEDWYEENLQRILQLIDKFKSPDIKIFGIIEGSKSEEFFI